ncbi:MULTISPECIES: ATP-binding cassette domain-containing protein [Streptomyces]|uniref:ABC-type quaternary amine transporter n=2 Tax=Streptomyces bottropensis TaxID=42235 RepID=M3FYP5_9ACTN|nr:MULTISPECIES: ATP-binding cassette domain-containing protein [Streptomyces]EMF58205.1 ABC transporter ATP-binding protein [Streptomyces bottropensis ATCC 25435]MZD18687.1 ATP-binding cassette domain-containing protein [Streptomyces sp. SID5476]
MIRFDAVSKKYPNGTTAVDELSLELAEGGITVLVGPSGCGKTTTLRMINRMVEPTAGTVSLRGRDIRAVNAPELRRGIGYVIQHAGLFPHRTILDNIATVPLLLGWGRKKARARAAELLELVGLPAEMAKRYPNQLSGGQQQRVGVARALGADPPVLLMDEPFSAVDPIVRAELQAEFIRLQKELHKTIVFVTHDIDEAIRLGDNIAVFRTGGKLAQFDSPERLLARPADEFVADFVGQDRGIRRLSFVDAAELPLRDGPVVPVASSVAEARRADAPWVLVVDEARRPLGWAATDALPATGTLADVSLAPLGHTFGLDGDSARAALDSALLSPARLAVAVDARGAVVGVADAYELSAGAVTAAEAAENASTASVGKTAPAEARAAVSDE